MSRPRSEAARVVGIVERYLECVGRTHDWDALRGYLTENVVRVGPYRDRYEGRERYVAFLADLMPRLAGYEMRVDRVVYAGTVAVAELSETVEVDGERTVTPEALVFDLDDDGRIAGLAVYVQSLPSRSQARSE
jgi:hypothetical protein